MAYTYAQRRGNLSKKLIAKQRWNAIQSLIPLNLTKKEIAERMSMTVEGLNSLLYRETGSALWPPKTE